MRFDVLGPLRVSGAHGPVLVPRGQTAATLACLVVHAGTAVDPTVVAAAIWSRPPADAVAKVKLAVRSLATILDPGTVEIGRRIRLVAPGDAVDAVRFERLVRSGRAALVAGAVADGREDLERAVALWRGPAFPELERAVAVVGVVDRLEALRLTTVEDLNALALTGPVDYPLVADLRAQLVLNPHRPRLHRQLAVALYRCGRQVEALGVLRAVRADHGDDDGRTARLEAAVLRHDPGLEVGGWPADALTRPGPDTPPMSGL